MKKIISIILVLINVFLCVNITPLNAVAKKNKKADKYIPQNDYAQVDGKYKYGAPINNNSLGDRKYLYYTKNEKKIIALDKKTLKEYEVFKYKQVVEVCAITDKYFFLYYGANPEEDIDGSYVYDYGVLRVNKNWKNPKILIKASERFPRIYIQGKNIYYIKRKNWYNYIYKMDFNGKNGKYLKKIDNDSLIVVKKGRLYYSKEIENEESHNNESLYSVNTKGKNAKEEIKGPFFNYHYENNGFKCMKNIEIGKWKYYFECYRINNKGEAVDCTEQYEISNKYWHGVYRNNKYIYVKRRKYITNWQQAYILDMKTGKEEKLFKFYGKPYFLRDGNKLYYQKVNKKNKKTNMGSVQFQKIT